MAMTIGKLRGLRTGPFTISVQKILEKHQNGQGERYANALQEQMRELLNNKELLKKITDALRRKNFNHIKGLKITGLEVTSAGLNKAKKAYNDAKKNVKKSEEQYEKERQEALTNLRSEQGKLNKIRGDLGEYITDLISSGLLCEYMEGQKTLNGMIKEMTKTGNKVVSHGGYFQGVKYEVSSQQKADVTFYTGVDKAKVAGISVKNYQKLHNYITLYSRNTNLMGLVTSWGGAVRDSSKFFQSLALYNSSGHDRVTRQTGESFMAIQAFMGASVNHNTSDTAQYFTLYTEGTAHVKFIPSLLKKAFEKKEGTIYQYFRFRYNPPLKEIGNVEDEKTVDEVFGQAHVGITATQQIINLITAEAV